MRVSILLILLANGPASCPSPSTTVTWLQQPAQATKRNVTGVRVRLQRRSRRKRSGETPAVNPFPEFQRLLKRPSEVAGHRPVFDSRKNLGGVKGNVVIRPKVKREEHRTAVALPKHRLDVRLESQCHVCLPHRGRHRAIHGLSSRADKAEASESVAPFQKSRSRKRSLFMLTLTAREKSQCFRPARPFPTRCHIVLRQSCRFGPVQNRDAIEDRA